MFTHELGKTAKSFTTGLTGILVNRSECLYGCNRYLIQPPASEGKVPDSWWFDEDDIEVIGEGVSKPETNERGGPIARHC